MQHLLNKIGPGLLYAGAAVGVSHLVQSTRAGVTYGSTIVILVILVNAIKLPFFKCGSLYTSATGKNLLHGYKKQGNWTLWLFLVSTLVTVFTIQAAVTLVTAGLWNALFNFSFSTTTVSAFLLLAITLMLWIGKFDLLNRIMQIMIVLLSVCTVLATLILCFKYPDKILSGKPITFSSASDIAFIVAFIGWMPAPFDVAILHSIWTEIKAKNKSNLSSKYSSLDFNVGFIGTAFLAICFVLMGSLLFYNTQQTLPSNATEFAKSIINFYGIVMGDYAKPLIAIAAFSTMLSTTIAVLDGFSRVFAQLYELLGSSASKISHTTQLKISNFVLAAGAIAILTFFKTSFKDMIDFATTSSFIVAPLIAYLNLKSIDNSSFPQELKPSKIELRFAWSAFFLILAFTGYYVYYLLTF